MSLFGKLVSTSSNVLGTVDKTLNGTVKVGSLLTHTVVDQLERLSDESKAVCTQAKFARELNMKKALTEIKASHNEAMNELNKRRIEAKQQAAKIEELAQASGISLTEEDNEITAWLDANK